MKETGRTQEPLSQEFIFDNLIEILHEVAEYKITGEITLQTSLAKDYAFDSIDIMGVLLKVQERFLKDKPILDIDQFVNRAFRGTDGAPVTIAAMCDLIREMVQR
jgi:acyl carrier protein